MSAPRVPRSRLQVLPGGKPETVQTPAMHPEDRRAGMLRAEYLRGFDAGERAFYTRGWRHGFGDGVIVTLIGATLALACGFAWLGGWRPW